MADDDNAKLEDRLCAVVNERTYIDFNRFCARLDMKPSQYLRFMIKRELYGAIAAESELKSAEKR